MSDESLERELERRIEALGLEFVELERAGSKTRPILRVRIDLPDSAPGKGVSIDDCTRVSRALESYLDEAPELSERYVLEVSSPGLERPLVRRRDFERFAGREVAVKGTGPLAGRKEKRLTGELVGVSGEGGQERITLRLEDGSSVEIPRAEIARANLVFRWD
ncbi:MAG TPA: ribosome maturation factor RimP [Longimicrobiales bacterium]|nr:ribosome maturation factor RimP [Longimicrobiales bacterium]